MSTKCAAAACPGRRSSYSDTAYAAFAVMTKLCIFLFFPIILSVDSFFVQPPFFQQRLRQDADRIQTNKNTIPSGQHSCAKSQSYASTEVDPIFSSVDIPEILNANLTVESYKLNQLGPMDTCGNRVLYRISTKESSVTAIISQLGANAVPRVRISVDHRLSSYLFNGSIMPSLFT